jgi:hypothetical protein
VTGLAEKSCIVAIAVDDTAGVLWEMDLVSDPCLIHKTLFLIPPRYSSSPRTAALLEHSIAKLYRKESDDAVRAFFAQHERVSVGWYVEPDGRVVVLTTTEPSELAYLLAVRLFARSVLRTGCAETRR